MKDHQQDVLLIYFKRKDGIPLTKDEEQAWAQYRDRYPLPDGALFDEQKLLEIARLQQQKMLPWEQFKQKHNIQFPSAPPHEKQEATVQVVRSRYILKYLTVAASLLVKYWAIAVLLIMMGGGACYYWLEKLADQDIDISHLQMNHKQVPRGEIAQLQLTDGTEVWLNAASSFKYPAEFSQRGRVVELLSGEAFFEVTKQAPSRPFIIKVRGKEIRVLGTKFNVKVDSARDEMVITLLEGKVKLANGRKEVTLKVGQQAVMDNRNVTFTHDPQLDDIAAWRKGVFVFHGTRLSIIMDELAQWYGVQVEYKDSLMDVPFTISEWPRYHPLDDLLKGMEASRLVKFDIVGNKVIVSANNRRF